MFELLHTPPHGGHGVKAWMARHFGGNLGTFLTAAFSLFGMFTVLIFIVLPVFFGTGKTPLMSALCALWAISWTLAAISWILAVRTTPGELRPWMKREKVEVMVESVLREEAGRDTALAADAGKTAKPAADLSPGDGVARGVEMEEDRERSANRAVAVAMAERYANGEEAAGGGERGTADVADVADQRSSKESEEQQQQNVSGTSDSDDDTAGGSSSGVPAPVTDAELRRRRRAALERRGLPVLTVAQVAQEAQRTISSWGAADTFGADYAESERAVEMEWLLGGAALCTACNAYAIMDVDHCVYCRSCFRGLSHHCICVGQCVGQENRKFFVLFVLYTTVHLIAATIMGFWGLHKIRKIELVYSEDRCGAIVICAYVVELLSILWTLMLTRDGFAVANGESSVTFLKRERRQDRQDHVRRVSRGGTYAPLFDEEEPPANSASMAKTRRVFGTSSVFPWWFLPVSPSWLSEAEEEVEFAHEVCTLVQDALKSKACEEEPTESDEGRE